MCSECEFVFNAYLSSTLIQELMNSLIYQYGIAHHVASTQEIYVTVERVYVRSTGFIKNHTTLNSLSDGALDWPTDSKVEVLAWRQYPQKFGLQISTKDQIFGLSKDRFKNFVLPISATGIFKDRGTVPKGRLTKEHTKSPTELQLWLLPESFGLLVFRGQQA